MVASVGIGATASAGAPECNWGRLTADSIRGGFNQGPHASDPSGDGHGPGTLDEPRLGLANVVERGNLDGQVLEPALQVLVLLDARQRLLAAKVLGQLGRPDGPGLR